MIRKLPLIVFVLFLTVFASSAKAQSVTTGSAQTASDAATKLQQQMQLLQEQRRVAATAEKQGTMNLIQAKREEFKLQIQTIKDQRKKAVIQRIDTGLISINAKQTSRYAEVVSRLQTRLDKFNSVATEAASFARITVAQNALSSAKAAIEAQAIKSYTITITDETSLRLNAGTAVNQLKQDLIVVYKLLIDAKQAVQGLNVEKTVVNREATSSAGL